MVRKAQHASNGLFAAIAVHDQDSFTASSEADIFAKFVFEDFQTD